MDIRPGAVSSTAAVTAKPAGPSQNARFEQVFAKVKGASAVDHLRRLAQANNHLPTIVLCGEQLTGKSAARKALAPLIDPSARRSPLAGGDQLFRPVATARGIALVDFTAAAKKDPALDVEVDYVLAQAAASGSASVIDSRLGGQLALWLKTLGRTANFTVMLTANNRERALRYVGREISAALRRDIEPRFDVSEQASLQDTLAALGRLQEPQLSSVAQKITADAERDANDDARLFPLYGVHFADKHGYDCVLDTSGLTPEQVVETVWQKFCAWRNLRN